MNLIPRRSARGTTVLIWIPGVCRTLRTQTCERGSEVLTWLYAIWTLLTTRLSKKGLRHANHTSSTAHAVCITLHACVNVKPQTHAGSRQGGGPDFAEFRASWRPRGEMGYLSPPGIPHTPNPYRGISLIRKRTPPGPFRRPMPRVLGGSQGGGRFLMGEVPL